MAVDIVVIGVSAGGLDALCRILGDLQPLTFALAIVQHRSKDSEGLCEVLQRCSGVPVHEVNDKEVIAPGQVYVAPADYHLLVEDGHFELSLDAPVQYSRPSIDLAFESAADAYGSRAVGLVMTGANMDGSRGLRRIVDRGGHAVVQDPATAEVAVMPAAAVRAVPEADVVPLGSLAGYLTSISATASVRGEDGR
jgi:two-component system chemotaxis response regulator CheB